jgi:predicted phage baseplate assembly protein
MAFPEPVIDARSYQEILNEALARIPVHNPEWTNHNDSDPGITILQLFAFMSESLLYRANLVPERNRLKFLRLLGVPLQPAEPARGLVEFSNPRGTLAVELLPADLELTAGAVPFRVLDAVDVLPIEAVVFYKATPELTASEQEETDALYRELYASHLADGAEPLYYETRRFEPAESGAALPVLSLEEGADTVDGCLWLALLARSADEVARVRRVIANRVLTLGVVPALSEAERVLLPGDRAEDSAQGSLIFELPHPANGSGAAYRAVQARPKANLLIDPGVVELILPTEQQLGTWDPDALPPLEAGVGDFPPALDDEDVGTRVITWLRIRAGDVPETVAGRIEARVSYVGINVARVTQRSRVFGEFLGQGTGEPGQTLTVANRPVLEESVLLTVNGEPWRRTDDLAAAPPEVPRRSPRLAPGVIERRVDPALARVFTVDRDSGASAFGTGHAGARPPRGAVIQASYDYGGGLRGMVGIGAITKGASLPSGVKVTNPVPTWGASEGETLGEAEQRIPRVLRHRERLVSEEDFDEITRRTPGVHIGRVEVLPLAHPELPDMEAEGVVTVLVIPRFDAAQPDAPRPDRLFLDSVCAHLAPRRLLTTEVHVRGPVYVPIYVSVGIDVAPGHDVAPVREGVQQILRAFLSPLHGGYDGAGWPLQRGVEAPELTTVASRTPGLAKITGLLLAEGESAARDRVAMRGLQLPRLAGLSVQVGEPLPLDALRGAAPLPGGPRTLPIPIVPAEC